ncbi:MAG: thioredoxin-disulfide reductase [Ruminococcaceae bacterium]|nr:thioredoxin-disulfide reductase [Oscillospiraceae bacterium]
MKHIYDMLIIGGGPGGYTAALYAARAGLDAVLLERLSAGGQLALTHQIDNYPGADIGIDGWSLAEKMKEGAEHFGAKTVLAEVTALALEGDVKSAETTEGSFHGRTVVISTGANPRELGLEGEWELTGRGVHYCAACDGMFYRGKTVVVVGGGNTAAADALLLSRLAERVILVHRRETLRATKIYHEPILSSEKIEKRWTSAVTELVRENEKLVGVRIKDLQKGTEELVPCDGVFVSIGRKPATEVLGGQVRLDEGGYVAADESTKTNIPGVYAVGDVRSKALRQVVTAVGDGAVAVHHAEEYLASAGKEG